MTRFFQADRDNPFLLPPSVDEWLPQGHLARILIEYSIGLISPRWLKPTPGAAAPRIILPS